jgi:UrcA family protein
MLKFTRFTATLAATLCLAAATPAFAERFESNGKQVEVRYGDLDLTNADHQKELRQRISAAATKVCANTDFSQYTTCRTAVLRHTREPVAVAVAKAGTNARYADAGKVRVQVGN